MDLHGWLRSLGFEHYEPLFRENGIDADVLPDLTEPDLEKLGINLGDRKRLLKGIARLGAKQREPSNAPRPAPTDSKAEPLPTGVSAERRQVTVLLIDLVGSTALARRLDPEDMRELLSAYQAIVTREITQFGGRIAKFMGDGVLAYFGWPVAYEDAAEQAIRSGLAAADQVSKVRSPDGAKLACRVGIATGDVVIGDLLGDGAAQEEAVVGETPNLAARLQALGTPNAVLLAESTRRLVGDVFELADRGSHQLKGFDCPERVFQALGESKRDRFEALHPGGVAPLVGREQELGLLLDRWGRAVEGEGQVVLLTGEPGTGKSRLIRALRDEIKETFTALSHFGSPYFRERPFYPIASLLERAAGFTSDASAAEKFHKLEPVLEGATDDVSEALSLVGDLLGIEPAKGSSVLLLTGAERRERTTNLLMRQLEYLASRKPVLAIYEDAQWFDPSTVELLGRVVHRVRDMPVLAVVTTRPGFHPPWAGLSHVTHLSLGRLRRKQAGALVEWVLGSKRLSEQAKAHIVQRTDGVPLFLEELTKAVVETGLLIERDGELELSTAASSAIPSTLQGSLLARLDRLGAVKEVAQVASVLGREFSLDLLLCVMDCGEPELRDALERLLEAEIVFQRESQSRPAYVFKHALVQDAAYQSLLKVRRQQLHGKVAEAIERDFPAIAQTQPEFLAHHLMAAGLTLRATAEWQRAGTLALDRGAMKEGAVALERAVDLLHRLPPSLETKQRELEMLSKLGVAYVNTKGPASAEVADIQRRAASLAADLGDSLGAFRARWTLWRSNNARAEYRDALAVAGDLMAQAERESNPDYRLQAHHAFWSTKLFLGELGAASVHIDSGLAIYDKARHCSDASVYGGHDAGECALTQKGTIHFILGHPDQAAAAHSAGLEHALEIGHPQVVGHALNWGLLYLHCLGDLEGMRARTDLLLALTERHALQIYQSEARFFDAWLKCARDHDVSAADIMEENLDRRIAMGTALVQTHFFMLVADARLRLGQPDLARVALRRGLDHAERTGEGFSRAELHRLNAACHLSRQHNDTRSAETALKEALTDARGRGARMWELRAARDLCRLWADQGERSKGFDLLAPVIQSFSEGFETDDFLQAKSLLNELR